jgi:hypothetical protein
MRHWLGAVVQWYSAKLSLEAFHVFPRRGGPLGIVPRLTAGRDDVSTPLFSRVHCRDNSKVDNRNNSPEDHRNNTCYTRSPIQHPQQSLLSYPGS